MDISRLPVVAHGYGLPAHSAAASRNRHVEPVSAVEKAQRPGEAAERVVQGEFLEHTRRRYDPTQDYLRARQFDGELQDDDTPAGGRASPYAGQHAVGAYMSHTRDLIQPDINRGNAVDYFI